MDMLSIHDNHVLGYEVDGVRRRIVLHTRFDERQPAEHTDVVFEGVLDYFFQQDSFENTLFGIEAVPTAGFLANWQASFEENSPWCWPRFWKGTPEATLRHLEEGCVKVFEISASLGLCGWVVAHKMRLERIPPAEAFS